MRTVWKFPLSLVMTQQINMPEGAEALSVAYQEGSLVMWAMVDSEAPRRMRTIWVTGTGQPMIAPKGCRFVGTVLWSHGFVWHVFVEADHA